MSTQRKSRADRFRWFWRIENRIESAQARWLGFSGISLIRRTPVLVLETRGRRTGRRHRVGLAYWHADGVYFVGGGAAGMSRVDWVANLRSNPAAAIWVKRKRLPVLARDLAGDEYETVRAEAFRRWPDAPKYEAKSGRRIPYFALEPVDNGDWRTSNNTPT